MHLWITYFSPCHPGNCAMVSSLLSSSIMTSSTGGCFPISAKAVNESCSWAELSVYRCIPLLFSLLQFWFLIFFSALVCVFLQLLCTSIYGLIWQGWDFVLCFANIYLLASDLSINRATCFGSWHPNLKGKSESCVCRICKSWEFTMSFYSANSNDKSLDLVCGGQAHLIHGQNLNSACLYEAFLWRRLLETSLLSMFWTVDMALTDVWGLRLACLVQTVRQVLPFKDSALLGICITQPKIKLITSLIDWIV